MPGLQRAVQGPPVGEWYETDSAMLVLGDARLGVALVDGLLTRTYFRSGADAVKRAGVASSHIYELGDRLAGQAQELARRGYPVDGDIDDLCCSSPVTGRGADEAPDQVRGTGRRAAEQQLPGSRQPPRHPGEAGEHRPGREQAGAARDQRRPQHRRSEQVRQAAG